MANTRDFHFFLLSGYGSLLILVRVWGFALLGLAASNKSPYPVGAVIISLRAGRALTFSLSPFYISDIAFSLGGSAEKLLCLGLAVSAY